MRGGRRPLTWINESAPSSYAVKMSQLISRRRSLLFPDRRDWPFRQVRPRRAKTLAEILIFILTCLGPKRAAENPTARRVFHVEAAVK